MSKKQYDLIMRKYYKVLINAWEDEMKKTARKAVQMLYNMSGDKLDSNDVLEIDRLIRTKLGEEFSAAVGNEVFSLTEKAVQQGFAEAATEAKFQISWQFKEQNVADIMGRQNLFWVRNHYGADISEKFTQSLTTAVKEGLRKDELASLLRKQFRDMTKGGISYFRGLAEHTMLRMREFGRLSGYERAGAIGYRLIVVVDDRTSDICMALHNEDRVYPLTEALQIRDKLMAINPQDDNLETARNTIKALAPWVKEENVIYDSDNNPVGVQGAYTPFPPFHWRCRTTTAMVYA